tara:strand:- start:125 stop:244 length:120 start_codon:yes stop_codon:yes gene_type:complete
MVGVKDIVSVTVGVNETDDVIVNVGVIEILGVSVGAVIV